MNNRDKISKQNKEKHLVFGRRRNIKTSEWKKKNRNLVNAATAFRRAAKKKATPDWLTVDQKEEIRVFYAKAVRRVLEVDHIIPLKGKNVCGLHVPWNLQLLTAKQNREKGNSMTDHVLV